MPPAAARVWPPALAPTAEFMLRTKPATTPTATELTAIMPTFVSQRFFCIAVSFPDPVNQKQLEWGNRTARAAGGKLAGNVSGNWRIGMCRLLAVAEGAAD